MLSFVLLVVIPAALSAGYLFFIANDQYSSRFGFSVRTEELSSAQSLLGGLASLSGSSSSDTDILYEFIQSRTLIERIDARLDLVEIYSKPAFDPIFAYDPDGAIEDLVNYWQRMVSISYSTGSGLLDVRANAFTAEDAYAIAQAIVDESSTMINKLSTIARSDATRYAKEDLDQALARLKTAREALTRFRSETRIVDPSADIQGQMGLMNSLEAQLSDTIIEMNLLMQTASESDPRVEQAQRRIAVIQSLIEKERQKFGMGRASDPGREKDYSTLVGEFERLMVDREYAETAFLAAQAAVDTAQAEAQRQSRYLATYAEPSLPQSVQYPKRFVSMLVICTFLVLGWSIAVLVYYGIRDRK